MGSIIMKKVRNIIVEREAVMFSVVRTRMFSYPYYGHKKEVFS